MAEVEDPSGDQYDVASVFAVLFCLLMATMTVSRTLPHIKSIYEATYVIH